MSAAEELASIHLRRDPAMAAKILETLPAAETRRVLDTVSPKVAAGVITRMLPAYASEACAGMPAERAAELLRHCDNQQSVAVLRSMPEADRGAILGKIDVVRATTLRMLLHYPETVVGAWIHPDVLTLSDDLTVGEARTRLREAPGKVFNRLFVLDRNRHVRYAIDALNILTRSRNERLADVAQEVPRTVPARVPISEAAGFDDWAQHHELPVVNRDGEFIGVLSFAMVRPAVEGLELVRRTASNTVENLNDLTAIFVAGSNAIWRTWLELLYVNRTNGKRNG